MAMKDITDNQVCEAYYKAEQERGADWENEYDFPYEILAKETGQPEKVCYKTMERACDRGLIEFGVSLRTGWLTDKGKELIGIIDIPDNGLKWADVQ